MKRILITLIALSLCSCADTTSTSSSTTSTTSTNSSTTTSIVAPAANAKFVAAVSITQTILEIGGKLALSTQSSTTQLEFAKYLSGSGHVFESLETGMAPTSAQVTNALAAYFPTTSSQYTTIVQLATAAVSGITDAIKAYVPANAANYAAYVNYSLEALAKTAYTVADPYLTSTTAAQ